MRSGLARPACRGCPRRRPPGGLRDGLSRAAEGAALACGCRQGEGIGRFRGPPGPSQAPLARCLGCHAQRCLRARPLEGCMWSTAPFPRRRAPSAPASA